MKRVGLIAGITVVGLAIIGVLVIRKGRDFGSLSPMEACQKIAMDSTVVLLDVRTEKEYRSETGHLAGAILMPVEDLQRRLAELGPFRSRTIVVYCRAGRRSADACALLVRQGFTAVNLEGGIIGWADEGFPVVYEKENK